MSQDTKVVTPEATLSYPNIAKTGKPDKDGNPGKYSATLVFTPGTDMSAIYAAELAAATAKFGTMVGPKKNIPIADAFKKGILSSVIRTDAEAKGYPKGSTFINTRSNTKPGVVWNYAGEDKRPAPMSDEDILKKLYPGAKVRASINAFTYDRAEKKGVSFGLNNVQWLADGERIDSRTAAADDFTADLSAKPADLSDME